MNEPIKIIYKVKNNNEKPQYYIYIYIGNVPDVISKILGKIKEASLYDTLNMLTKNEFKELDNYYGEKWYGFFFNKHHINNTCKYIITNKQADADIVKKYGEQWVATHLKTSRRIKQQPYTYGMVVKRNLVHHELRTKKKYEYLPASNTDYEMSGISNRPQIDSDYDVSNNKQFGGGDEEESYEENDEMDTEDDTYQEDETFTEEMEDDTELEKLYMETESVSKNEIDKTTSLIKQAMDDENILKKKESKMIKFDVSKDTNIYKENIGDVYVKNYVTEQYIFKDDAIKVIKNKICASIKNNPKFGKKSYIMPSRQYLWGEYYFNNDYEKIMIGIKWTQKNELLKVDVEPNDNIKVYEELRNSIKTLRNDMKRFNSKIRKEDEENNILIDYDGYYDNNELYLIDIYNELGKNYNPTPEALTNVIDTYIRIYFPKIPQNEIRSIIEFLGENQIVERERMLTTYEIVNADLLLENEIVNLVEKIKGKVGYKRILKENYVTQSMIHVLLHSEDTENFKRIDLFKIFDDIVPSKKYPFIQYMTTDGNVSFKFNEEEMDKYSQNKNILAMVTSWFQNVSYGLSFKIRTDDMTSDDYRFMTVNINDLGKLDYKIQWKEDDKAIIDDITKTYNVIGNLIEEINQTSIKKKFDIPEISDYKTAFITTIQRFELDNDYVINHNDLSKFARYFFPYFALVIEPRKRVSKIHENELKSKFGTYLRYKRISKYENVAKIEQKIYYFIRNYEYTDQLIINEISKQFNITPEKAEEHLKRTLQKYSHIRKARKELKKFDVSPKYKSPGIDIAIQGKTKDKYKIRVSGARDKQQLQRIITVLNVLLYLYMETYLAKKQEWQYLKETLKKLNNIAERRHIVNDYVKYSEEKMNIKTMANADKRRIGFKPEKGQSHWTRVCQNSGTQQRRRPQQYTSEKLDDLLKQGYAYNKATGMYERKIVSKKNGKMVSSTLKAVKLNELDETGNPVGNEIYYTCSPEQNGIHMYVGFLTRSKNPNGEFMPCCFKKDQSLSLNDEKRNFFLKCIGKTDKNIDQPTTSFSDQLYILQDTNKIQPGRFGFLPKILDFYMNDMMYLKRVIAQHYLVASPNGYFFKYGIEHGDNSFLSAIATALDMSINNIIEKVIGSLNGDKTDMIFTALNNGDIKTKYAKRDKYIEYLKNVKNIDYEDVYHVLTIPKILMISGLNIVIIVKSHENNVNIDNEKFKENCYIVCQNSEEISNIEDPKRETILLYNEHDKYYPIFNVVKQSSTVKEIVINKTYFYDEKKENILRHIKDFYYKNCMERTIRSIINKNGILNAKSLCEKLYSKSIEEHLPKYQYIDVRNKCRYIITKNNTILPIIPSGSLYNIPIINKLDKYLDTYENTLKNIMKIYEDFKGELPFKPTGINGYVHNNENNVEVRAMILQSNERIPLKVEVIHKNVIEKDKMMIDTTPSYENIDIEIEAQPKNRIADERIKNTNYDKYFNESYELFRYAFSDYINKRENLTIKERIHKLIHTIDNKNEKIHKLKVILYRLIDSNLLNLYLSLTKTLDDETKEGVKDINEQNGGKYDRFIQIIDSSPDMDNYKLKNIRELCPTSSKDVCSKSPHCKWTHSGCLLALTKKMAITFVNKITVELIDNGTKAHEIMQIDGNYVSDVVNKNHYTERDNQKVIKSTSDNIKKTIEIFFGKDKMDTIGKRMYDPNINDVVELAKEYPMKDYGKYYIQTIMPNNNTILRAYANCFHWIENKYQDKYIRNLGFYSQKQTDIMVYLKSLIIDWVLDKNNNAKLDELLKKYTTNDTIYTYVMKLAVDTSTNSTGDIELYILNRIQKTPIVIYKNDIIYMVYDGKIISDKLDNYIALPNAINIQFTYDTTNINNNTPIATEVIYYK